MILAETKYSSLAKKEAAKIDGIIRAALKNKKPKSLYEPCSYILSGGGKKLRPLLLLFSAKAGGSNFNTAYNAAAAMEIVHNFTLAHDDIMDNSPIRRGRETLHRKYDVSTAILAGDTLFAVAYDILLKDCKKNVNSIVSTFTNAIIEVCEGQSLDKEFETRESVSISEYKKMIYKKTAALLEASCRIGILLAGGSSKEVKAAGEYGKYLGLAFQVQDDLLDIAGDQDAFGKKIGSDLIEGKKTFLFLTALQRAKDSDNEKLLDVIKNKGINPEELEFYKSLYERLGVIDKARKEIKSYTKLALRSLDTIKNQEGKQLLTWLANSLIDRNK